MREPDWTIDDYTRPFRPSEEQRALLEKIERVLLSFGRRPEDPEAAMTAVAPLVVALADLGMTATQIADHSRIRPIGVNSVLDTPFR